MMIYSVAGVGSHQQLPSVKEVMKTIHSLDRRADNTRLVKSLKPQSPPPSRSIPSFEVSLTLS